MSRSKAEFEAEIRRLQQQASSLRSRPPNAMELYAALARLLADAPVLLWCSDRDLRISFSAGKLTCDRMVGTSLLDYLVSNARGVDPPVALADALEGRSSHFAAQLFEWEVEGWAGPMIADSNVVTGTIGLALDVSEKRSAERQAATAFERYRTLFDASSEVFVSHEFDGAITFVNGAVEPMLGYSRQEALSLKFTDLLAPECRSIADQRVHSLMAGMTPQTWETTALSKSGGRVALEVRSRLLIHDGQPIGAEAIARDITERRALEEKVRQSQKMDAIGVLAGGIAHDFNNLLTGILGYAYMMQSDPEMPASAVDALDVIVKSGERAAQLTAQLLGFAKHSKGQNAPTDLHETIRDVVQLLERTIDRRIRITTSLLAARSHVTGDSNQLYQLLLNLCVNARDAMPEGGDLRILTCLSGTDLLVSVQDTGTGIPPDILERIFEPFFTTKSAKKGTGMGLAMVYAIAKNHGGNIHVESEPGKGSIFRVRLPVCDHAGVLETAEEVAPTGCGRILVIDDEEVVRRVVTKMLRGLGYDVIAIPDTHEAIEYFREHCESIDLVIVDMIMPRTNGVDCLAALRKINPQLPALFSSGYVGEGGIDEIVRLHGVEFLQKPYRVHELASSVRRALSKRTDS